MVVLGGQGNCLFSRGERDPLLLTPNPEDPWVAALGLNWGVTSPEKDVVPWDFWGVDAER